MVVVSGFFEVVKPQAAIVRSNHRVAVVLQQEAVLQAALAFDHPAFIGLAEGPERLDPAHARWHPQRLDWLYKDCRLASYHMPRRLLFDVGVQEAGIFIVENAEHVTDLKVKHPVVGLAVSVGR